MHSIEQTVRTLLAQEIELELPVEQIGVDEDLTSYGLNSLFYVKLVVAIETHFGIEFDDMALDINTHPTIGSLVAYIQQQQS